MPSSVPRLQLGGRSLAIDTPALMGIVNATPDSFSDGGRHATLEERVRFAKSLVADGATIIDIGGQSGITGVPEISEEEEIARVVPVIQKLHGELPDVVLSVDTYRPCVVDAALQAGALIINDISGLLYPEVADLCAAAGAGLVIMHTRSRPKTKVLDPDLYADVTDDVVDFLQERLTLALSRGLPPEATILDPGPDFAKTPYQTVAVLRSLDRVQALGRPILLALSRKDFVGALTQQPPRARLAGTLAAFAPFCTSPGYIMRVHDVAELAAYLETADALAGHSAGQV